MFKDKQSSETETSLIELTELCRDVTITGLTINHDKIPDG